MKTEFTREEIETIDAVIEKFILFFRMADKLKAETDGATKEKRAKVGSTRFSGVFDMCRDTDSEVFFANMMTQVMVNNLEKKVVALTEAVSELSKTVTASKPAKPANPAKSGKGAK